MGLLAPRPPIAEGDGCCDFGVFGLSTLLVGVGVVGGCWGAVEWSGVVSVPCTISSSLVTAGVVVNDDWERELLLFYLFVYGANIVDLRLALFLFGVAEGVAVILVGGSVLVAGKVYRK